MKKFLNLQSGEYFFFWTKKLFSPYILNIFFSFIYKYFSLVNKNVNKNKCTRTYQNVSLHILQNSNSTFKLNIKVDKKNKKKIKKLYSIRSRYEKDEYIYSCVYIYDEHPMVMSSAPVRGWNYQPLNTRIAHECW